MTISSLVALAGALAISTFTKADPSGMTVASERTAYNADCTPKGYVSDVIAKENYGGSNYKLVLASKEGEGGWVIYQNYLIVEDGAGCKVLSSGYFLDALPTDSMANSFAEAHWRAKSDTPDKKKAIEEMLARSPIAQADANSLTIHSADIRAFQRLGIEYPEYFKGIDTFKSFEEAQEYYDTIFTDEWFEKHSQGPSR